MKIISRILLLAIFATAFAPDVFADSYVRGHYTKNGTYVQGHMRKSPSHRTGTKIRKPRVSKKTH